MIYLNECPRCGYVFVAYTTDACPECCYGFTRIRGGVKVEDGWRTSFIDLRWGDAD